MGLEAVEFISDLVPNWPLPTDKRREGDDHLRAIKKTLKATFPNLNGAVTATPAQLNNLPANIPAIVTELKKHLVPKGSIQMWSGADASVPVGWALCNGQVISGFGTTPDLRNRFIKASGAGNPAGTTGGDDAVATSTGGAHAHTAQGHALTVQQMPLHSHRLFVWNGTGSSQGDGWDRTSQMAVPGEDLAPQAYRAANDAGQALLENTGSGQTHTHAIDSTGDHSHTVSVVPIFYTLAFIIKVTAYVDPV